MRNKKKRKHNTAKEEQPGYVNRQKQVHSDADKSSLKALNERETPFQQMPGWIVEGVNFRGPPSRFFQTLSLEQVLCRASRPKGSLLLAERMAQERYPDKEIFTDFHNVPQECRFPYFGFPFQRYFQHHREGYVLVAFMYRYHEHVMRHGVYLKDCNDRESKVEFYLDHRNDNPYPFFSYSQVKPGGYICLQNPVMHLFLDGSVGIRIDDPSDVWVLDIETVMYTAEKKEDLANFDTKAMLIMITALICIIIISFILFV